MSDFENIMADDSISDRVAASGTSTLPNPYSLDFNRIDDTISKSKADYESADRHRLKFGRLARLSLIHI